MKKAICITLTDKGIMKLDNICNYYGMNKSVMIELLITLHQEKVERSQNEKNENTQGKGCKNL